MTDHPPLKPGTIVKTTQLDEIATKGYMKEYLLRKKWGQLGVILTHHDAHGLCYEVRHLDGEIAYYEPTELECSR